MASKRLVERPGNTIEELAEVIEGRARAGRKVAVLMGLIGLVAGVGLTSAGYAFATAQDERSDRVEVDLTTVAVERRDVSLYTEFAGSLGYEISVAVTTRDSGIITSIASEGSDRDRGDILYTLDSEPVVLMYGDLPAWRTLSTSSEDGPDILQLETNLAALGYTASGNMTVDEDFTYYTGVALKAWETDVGMSDPDRTFDPGQVVYLPGEIRVDTVVTRGTVASEGIEVLTAAVIDEVTDEVVGDHSVSSSHRPTQAVTLTVTTSDQSLFFEGLDVDIVLADDTIVSGVVTDVGDTPRRLSSGPNSELAVDVTIAVTGETEQLIEGPADVRVTEKTVEDALMVPVRALVALLEGGYAVEVWDEDGTHYAGVTTGVFQDGWVVVTGDLADGDLVVVPG